jgi:hypothetical protein
MKALLVLVVLFWSIGFGALRAGPESPESSKSPDALLGAYGFPAAAGLKHLCGEHVSGSGMEITWDAFASNAPLGEVVAFYEKKLGKAGMAGDSQGATWRFPVGAKRPERVLTVSVSTAEGPYRRCDGAALRKAQSVVMASRSATERAVAPAR